MSTVRAALGCLVSGAAFALAALPATAIQRDTFKDVRGRLAGSTLRLRIDLRGGGHALAPNTVSLDGVRYASERAPVLFGRLQTVYVERVTDEGRTRLGLTVYRSAEEARSLRASDIPQPGNPNPLYGQGLALFAQTGSTSVALELKAGKKDRAGQLAEIETLLDRVFFMSGEPSHDELVDYVRRHRGTSIGRLRDITGLDAAEIREILREESGP